MQLIQKGDLSTAAFSNNNTAVAGGVSIRVDAGSTVKAAIDAAITAAVSALPGDKFLQGLAGYNAATNVLTLNMSDGTTVSVDMSALVTDAVATAITDLKGAGGVQVRDNAGTLIGYLVAP